MNRVTERAQSRRAQPGRRDTSEDGGRNVGRIERWISGLGGAALLGAGMGRRSIGGMLVASGGAALVYRALSARCPVWRQLGIDTRQAQDEGADSGGIEVERAVSVMRPASEIYAFWRRLDNVPLFMSHIESVTTRDDGTSRWVARGAGMNVEWDAEITDDVPGRLIAWSSLPGGDVQTEGRVELTDAPHDRGTVVRVLMRMTPPGGVVGRALSPLLERLTRAQLGQDLRRLRQLLESGEVATGATRGGRDAGATARRQEAVSAARAGARGEGQPAGQRGTGERQLSEPGRLREDPADRIEGEGIPGAAGRLSTEPGAAAAGLAREGDAQRAAGAPGEDVRR